MYIELTEVEETRLEEIIGMFKAKDKEFLETDKIQPDRRLHRRSDLNAFLLLDKLVPSATRIVCAAEHDEIYLDTSLEELVKVGVTDEDIKDLIRSGVRYDGNGLCMFV